MNTRSLIVLLGIALLALGPTGCGPGVTEETTPAPETALPAETTQNAAPSTPAPREAPAQPEQPRVDTEEMARLKSSLQTSSQEIARAEAWAEDLKREIAEDEKKIETRDQKLWILEQTMEALRERLLAAGHGDWVLRVEGEDIEDRQDVHSQTNGLASGGKVLVLDKPSSSVELSLPVGIGCYRLVPVGKAPSPDHDAMLLTVKASKKDMGDIDIEKRVCFDRDFENFAGASGSPTIVVRQPGALKISLKTTEERGMSLDRIELRVAIPK